MSDSRSTGVPRWVTIAAIAVAAFTALMLLLDKIVMPALVHSQAVVTMPNVVGRKADEAVRDLNAIGFVIAQCDTHPDERYAAGTVLYQNPYGGDQAKEGRKVYLTISSGKELLSIPNVTGMPLRDAKIRLETAGLSVGDVTYESNNAAEETVLRQSGAGGSRIAIGSSIALAVSSGPAQQAVAVPALVGRTFAEAQTMVQSLKLELGQITYRNNRQVLPSTVLEQRPAAGDTVKEGTLIQLVVAGN